MANKKITQLTDIGSSITGTDILHIIDDPTGTPINKKVSVDNLFANIPGLINLTQTPETITATGAIGITEVITNITAGSTPLALTLADGVEGQLKFIVMTTHITGDSIITPTNLLGNSVLTFNAVGDSVLLLFTGGKWAVISNNGVTVA